MREGLRRLIDPKAIEKWKVPSGMTAHVHEFDGSEGGTFRCLDSGGGEFGSFLADRFEQVCVRLGELRHAFAFEA